MFNLTPLTKAANSSHEKAVESKVKTLVNKGAVVTYLVSAQYNKHPSGTVLVGSRLDDDKKNRKKVIPFLQKKYSPFLAWRLHCQFDEVTKTGKLKKAHTAWYIRNESQ